jgi:hypothetical protein
LSSAAERFNYDYTTDELVGVAAMTRELTRQAEITQVSQSANSTDINDYAGHTSANRKG